MRCLSLLLDTTSCNESYWALLQSWWNENSLPSGHIEIPIGIWWLSAFTMAPLSLFAVTSAVLWSFAVDRAKPFSLLLEQAVLWSFADENKSVLSLVLELAVLWSPAVDLAKLLPLPLVLAVLPFSALEKLRILPHAELSQWSYGKKYRRGCEIHLYHGKLKRGKDDVPDMVSNSI